MINKIKSSFKWLQLINNAIHHINSYFFKFSLDNLSLYIYIYNIQLKCALIVIPKKYNNAIVSRIVIG